MRCLVYDPDGLNPYGRELAALMHESGIDVVLISPRVPWWPEEISTKFWLGRSRQEDGLRKHIFRRLFGPIWAAIQSQLDHRTAILVWVRGPWESVVWIVASFFAKPLYVYHNPLASRDVAGLNLVLARILRRRSLCVTHTVEMQTYSMEQSLETEVVRHLPFRQWTKRFVPPETAINRHSALLIGALRADKVQIQELKLLAHSLAEEDIQLKICGRGPLPAHLAEEVEAGLIVDLTGWPFASDAQLGSALAEASVVVAPYRDVTQSGSLCTAFSAGKPAVAYESRAYEGILSHEFQVPVGRIASLAKLASVTAKESRSSWLTTADIEANSSANEWIISLAKVAPQ